MHNRLTFFLVVFFILIFFFLCRCVCVGCTRWSENFYESFFLVIFLESGSIAVKICQERSLIWLNSWQLLENILDTSLLVYEINTNKKPEQSKMNKSSLNQILEKCVWKQHVLRRPSNISEYSLNHSVSRIFMSIFFS